MIKLKKKFKPRGANPANWLKNQSKWIYSQIKDPTVGIIDYGAQGFEATSKYYIKEPALRSMDKTFGCSAMVSRPRSQNHKQQFKFN
jgi:hypothetical protein